MRSMQKFTLAFALFVALVLNASLSFYMHQFLTAANGVNLLMPVGMMLIALFDDTNKNEIWLAIGAGIISDIYFFGFIGIYALVLPLVCWLLQRAARFLPEVFWSRMLAIVIGAILIDMYSWLILNLLGISRISVVKLVISLFPTIGWSFIFALFTYRIWESLAVKHPFMVKLDNYRH